MSAYRRLILPFILIILALFLRQYMVGLYHEYGQLFDSLPYLLILASAMLAIFFNLSRNIIATLFLLMIYLVVQDRLQITLENFSALYAYTAICITTPLIALLLFIIPEKGLANKYGAINLGIAILVVLSPALLLVIFNEQILITYINDYFAVRPYENYIQSINSSILFLLVLTIGLYKLLKTNEEFIAANITTLISFFIIFSFFHIEKISTILITANAIVLITSTLRNSYNLAYRDELTGLLGRRALNDRMKSLGKKYVIAMMDVDHFKKFNDTYGHDIGDEVLKMVASKINAVSGGGIAYRYGGEEFCILFPGKIADEAGPFLEEVRNNIQNYEMVVRNVENRPKSKDKAIERRGRRKQQRDNMTASVTISIGAAERNNNHQKPEETLKNADTALYEAKKKGRNCTMVFRG
ncbi:MAG: GGDEF domain-containing protein [Gammaproteobacteria bacterium]|nr:GGDEF domain-containing protein [Gammaproteobacteria bacterium]